MSVVTTAALKFPVMCLSRDHSITVIEGAVRLHQCNALAFFKNRYHESLVIIDAEGHRFRVVRAEVVPALSTPGRWIARALNRRLHVELQLEAEGSGSLEDAKRLVNDWLGRAVDFWEASRSIEEWRDLVARASTARELIALFA